MPQIEVRNQPGRKTQGAVLALIAALLGWMFDGYEMGIFSLVARQAVGDLLQTSDEAIIGQWFSIATAGFLIGAATGGVLFGWLGDRLGRVRAMMLSILTYALFTGACGLSTSVAQIVGFRFIAALGMGGEWSLGVALVMELWPDRGRAWVSGLLGAAVNVGFIVVALVSLSLSALLSDLRTLFESWRFSAEWTGFLLDHGGWRLLLLSGTLPALLTLFIRFAVPESERWLEERRLGRTSHWESRDLLGVLLAAAAAWGIVLVWLVPTSLPLRIGSTVLGLTIAALGSLFPVWQYLRRAMRSGTQIRQTLGRMLFGAGLAGIPLIGTWAAVQWTVLWADELAGPTVPAAKALTAIISSLGAVVGTIAAAQLGDWWGRRPTYCVLCVGALAALLGQFQLNTAFNLQFLCWVFVAGVFVGSFYGLLALYFPELFPTSVRSIGQGFAYNYGRILAAVGTLQTGALVAVFGGSYPAACSVIALVYLFGVGLIWFGPETRGQGLPN